jgi:hypothetical protein
MPGEFCALPGSNLYAQSLKHQDLPFVIAAMFTGNRREHADRLKNSLETLALPFVIYEVPAVHRSISKAGTDDIAFCKPNFINDVLQQYGVPVLYVDADVIFRDRPTRVYDLKAENIGFAVYNWFGDVANDGYAPVEVIIDGERVSDRIYEFSHSIDVYDPTQLVVSGASQYYTPDARPLLQDWLGAIAQLPNVADDELLDYTYNCIFQKTLIHAYWWPKEYCRYPWWIHAKPIIDHPQPPAEFDASRQFKTVTGQERFKTGSLRTRPAQGPFPRDCMIDTQEKVLFRANENGVEVVDRINTDLWISRL